MMSTLSKATRLTGQVHQVINLQQKIATRTFSICDIAQSKLLRTSTSGNFSEKSGICFLPTRNLNTSEADINADIDQVCKLPRQDPKKGRLVYVGMITNQIKGIKIFSLSTSLLALGAQPIILSSAKDDFMFKAGLLGTFSAVIFCTPAIVHFVTRKYVTDVYFNDETKKFTLATKSLFLRRKEFEFTANDVIIPFVETMFTTHRIKGRAFFINKEDFLSKEAYCHMVGFDKPMDWGIKDPNAQNIPKKKKKFGLWEDEKSAEDKEKDEIQNKHEIDKKKLLEEAEEEKKKMSRMQ